MRAELNDAKIAITNGADCKVQGMERTINNSRGVSFLDIVKKLLEALKSGLTGERYKKEVNKVVRSAKMKAGFSIREVIGVGNIGTTMIA